MTPEQALQILNAATANLNGTREAHGQIIEALETIKKLIPTDAVKKIKEKQV